MKCRDVLLCNVNVSAGVVKTSLLNGIFAYCSNRSLYAGVYLAFPGHASPDIPEEMASIVKTQCSDCCVPRCQATGGQHDYIQIDAAYTRVCPVHMPQKERASDWSKSLHHLQPRSKSLHRLQRWPSVKYGHLEIML